MEMFVKHFLSGEKAIVLITTNTYVIACARDASDALCTHLIFTHPLLTVQMRKLKYKCLSNLL